MAKIRLTKENIVVRLEHYNETLRCCSIRGAVKIYDDEYEFPHSSILPVISTFYGYESIAEIKSAVASGALPEIIYKLALKYDEQLDKTEQLKSTGVESKPGEFLFKHQQLCREIAKINPRYAFFLETGTGKTPMSLQIIADDLAEHPEHRWLVICPLALINPAWIEDANKFFPNMRIGSLHKLKGDKLITALALNQVSVVNFESFKINIDIYMNFGFEGCFVDESSKLKNNNSMTTKMAKKFCKVCKRWYLLSGTPAPNSMLEYYPQMYTVDNNLLSKSFTSFKAKWFYSYNAGGFEKYDILPEKKAELIDIIKQKAIFISKNDCLDLPETMLEAREVTMDAATKKHYNTMKNELYASLKDTDVLAPSSVVALGKLNQLASGFIMDADRTVHIISKAKLNTLLDLLEEIGDRQVIIWANFHAEFDMIKEALGNKCVVYNGTKSLAEKDQAVKDFKEGKVQYFVANPKSAAYGLTLVNCHDVVYYCLDYSYETHAQSKDRTNRIGQTKSTTYYYLLMEKSIDYALFKCLHDKGQLAYSVLDHLKPDSDFK